VAGTYATVADQIEGELDLRQEAVQVKRGQVYSDAGRVGVNAMKLAEEFVPQKNVLIIEKAPGQTVKSFIDAAKNPALTQEERGQLIEQGRTLASQLAQLGGVWLKEVALGEGFYHGDMHAGNMLTDPEKGLTLIVFQNRRFDADFVTIRRLIREGAIGEVFQYDSFVGGYSRPCDYWHSDVAVSGGAIFDWGSHYLDQILDVFDQEIAYVSGVNHKRHWTHVTNADHSVVTVTFGDGTQATFVNSDLSAARPPKFRVFGTQGAIVADWDPAAEPAVADLPALVTLYAPDGSSRSITLDEVPAYTFHRELAAHLASGTPMQVSSQQSRNVVAVMEAAEESAKDLGRQVVPELLR
jgi:hypothetical protein